MRDRSGLYRKLCRIGLDEVCDKVRDKVGFRIGETKLLFTWGGRAAIIARIAGRAPACR